MMNGDDNILSRITDDTRRALAPLMEEKPFAKIEGEALAAPGPRDFCGPLLRARQAGQIGLIAEIKKASPSAGLIRAGFDAVDIARAYAKAGASCLSVVTEPLHFQGDPRHLREARAATHLPVLRKDFMVDPWQIAESRALDADCVLLILACLEDVLAQDMLNLAARYGMAALIEVHDEDELSRALRLSAKGPAMIGINNRNLKTLQTDLATTERLAPLLPEGGLVVSESGIKTRADVQRLMACGVSSFLVGENLLNQPDPGAAARDLLS